MLRVLMYYFHEAVWHKIPKKYDSKIFKLSLSLLILSFVLLISIEILKSLWKIEEEYLKFVIVGHVDYRKFTPMAFQKDK